MTGDPRYLTAPPRWAFPAAVRGAPVRRATVAGRNLSIALLDAVGLAVLWLVVTYAYAWYGRGSIAYMLVPWWAFALGVVEATALWESFGRSLGQRFARRDLVRADGGQATFGRRVVYFLGWHLSVLPVVGVFFAPPWHEWLSGLRLEQHEERGEAPRSWYRTSSGLFLATLFLTTAVAAVGVTITGAGFRRLFTDAWRTASFWKAFFSPDTSILVASVGDMLVTIYMAVIATAFAVVVAVPLSFLAARNLMRGAVGAAVYTALRGAMSIIRSIEPIVWAIIFLIWVTVVRAPFAGVLALWVHSIADLVKLYAERLEAIDRGPIEAVTATGAGKLSVLRYAVIPQIVNPYISFTLYRWDINIRMATVVGVVGGGGIGQRLYHYLTGNLWYQAGTVMILIVILVWAIDYLSARLRAKLA